LCAAEQQNLRVPSIVALAEALLPKTLTFLKIAESPDTIVAPTEIVETPLLALELHTLAPMMREMLPPQT
jgi:hypothetical protein